MPAVAKLYAFTLDCADPASLSAFYKKVTGWEETHSDDNFVYLTGDGISLGFQRIAGYRRPSWPDDTKHAHLDLLVPDLAAAEKELVALGAGKPEFQPGDGNWIVLTDPEGHPFCIAKG